jgi:hypothetical protein
MSATSRHGGGRIGSATEGAPDSLFQLVDRLSIELVRIIPAEEGSDRGSISLARITTDSPSALKAYLAGQELFRRSDYNGAFERYERATEIDSSFALAYYMQGLSAGWGGLEESVVFLENRASPDRLPPREALIVRGFSRSIRDRWRAGVSSSRRCAGIPATTRPGQLLERCTSTSVRNS